MQSSWQGREVTAPPIPIKSAGTAVHPYMGTHMPSGGIRCTVSFRQAAIPRVPGTRSNRGWMRLFLHQARSV